MKLTGRNGRSFPRMPLSGCSCNGSLGRSRGPRLDFQQYGNYSSLKELDRRCECRMEQASDSAVTLSDTVVSTQSRIWKREFRA